MLSIDRWKNRDSVKYNTQNLLTAFQTNVALSASTQKLAKRSENIFYDIDVTDLNIEQTKTEIVTGIVNRLQSFLA